MTPPATAQQPATAQRPLEGARRAAARLDTSTEAFLDAHVRGRAGLDWVMYGASAAGEHSICWLVLACAKGFKSGQGAKAALRGALLFGAESVLVNGAIKSVFRRKRPQADKPRPLPLRQPRTSSFPSGHASAAFVAAAVLRDEHTWPIYYALATIVASSRVYVRIHHASDVLGGAALGVVMGEVARKYFPLLPK